MTLIALVSAKGSPGVTTSALAMTLVWPGRVILAECDVAGGQVLPGYFAGSQDNTRSLLGLATAERRGDLALELLGQLLALDEDRTRFVLPGLADPAQAAHLSPVWDRLATVFAGLETADPATDVLADCGRLGTAHFPTAMLRRTDKVVLAVRSSLPSIAAARPWVDWLSRELSATENNIDHLGVLLIGEPKPYSSKEIADALGVPVVSELAHDPAAAGVLSQGNPAGRRFAHSALLRSARHASEVLRSQTANRRERLAVPTPNGHRSGRLRLDRLDAR